MSIGLLNLRIPWKNGKWSIYAKKEKKCLKCTSRISKWNAYRPIEATKHPSKNVNVSIKARKGDKRALNCFVFIWNVLKTSKHRWNNGKSMNFCMENIPATLNSFSLQTRTISTGWKWIFTTNPHKIYQNHLLKHCGNSLAVPQMPPFIPITNLNST